LDGFIKDILDYSRNARMEVQVEKIDFLSLITETQNNFTLIKGANRIKTNVEVFGRVDFNSDRTRLEVIMNNLFSNAIKYQDYNKKQSTVSIQIHLSPENALIKVADNGIGIEPKHLDKLFGMFYRASENSKGSGLGLYIARETVTKLGGSIKVESEFGQSTTFDIAIPNSPREPKSN
jgi:signal transduction histidine kinase